MFLFRYIFFFKIPTNLKSGAMAFWGEVWISVYIILLMFEHSIIEDFCVVSLYCGTSDMMWSYLWRYFFFVSGCVRVAW
jgi:hypothetical protein